MLYRSKYFYRVGAIVVMTPLALLSISTSGSLAQDGAGKGRAPVSGIEKANFSKSTAAKDDFYRYANDTWLETTQIPADQSNYGAFTALDLETKKIIQELIEAAGKATDASPIEKQVGNLYRSYTNIQQRNALGTKPIVSMIERIRAIATKPDALAAAGELSRRGVGSFFGFSVSQDAKQPDQYAVYVGQGGTTLPDRDYYLKDGESEQAIRDEYEKFIATMLTTMAWDKPEQFAKEIVDLETEFAKVQWTQVELRDPIRAYNKIGSKQFREAHPSLEWNRYAGASGVPLDIDLIIGQPSFFDGADGILEKTSLDAIKAYLAFKTIDAYAQVLTEDLEKTAFHLHETVLTGTTEQEPLGRRGVDICNALLGMPVGQLYVKKYFSETAKSKMEQLVKNVLKAFEKRIDRIEWMGQATKAQAKQKLSMITPKIGYPDKWKDYSSLNIVPDDIFSNMVAIVEFETAYQLQKLGKPIDRTEWLMPPQIVNAYYAAEMNEIVFPAAILQPPFFNLEADDAVNYGAIGAVIGHEISHGFDDSGSKYNGRGMLQDWWTTNDKAEFERRSGQLVAQYDRYSPIEGMNVQGKLTLGENIGDLGGLNVAYTGYQMSLDGRTAPVIEGLTGDQRFFLGWAQVWRRKYRDPELRRRLLTDPHSPSQYRCNGIVSNIDAFYDAFGVKPGDKMYIAPKDRVRIW